MKKILLTICMIFTCTTQAQTADAPKLKRIPVSFDNKNIVLLFKKDNQLIGQDNWKNIVPLEKVTPWTAIVTTTEGKEGYIDESGKWVYPPTFDEARGFAEGIARVQKGKQWGFIQRDGKVLVEPRYYYVSYFSQGLAKVQEKEAGDVYFINTQGKKAFDKTFWRAGNFAKNGLAPASTGESVPVFNITAEKTTQTQEKGEEKWGYINKQGEWVIKPQFNHASGFNEFNLAEVTNANGDSLLIDEKGYFVNNVPYEYLWDYSESGLAWAEKENDFRGYIDTKGKLVWKANYQDFEGEHNGLLLNHRGNFQYFTPRGKLVIKETSTWALSFYDAKHTIALRDDKWGILSRQGEFKPLKNIIAPYHACDCLPVGFIDGVLPMINQQRELVYFNRDGKVVYRFSPNATGKMALSDASGKTLWQSPADKQKLYSPLARYEELLADPSYNGKGIVDVAKQLLSAKPRKYYIPNPFSSGDDPYQVTEDIIADDMASDGAIKIVAEGYVGSENWGSYDFLTEAESETFDGFYKTMRDALNQAYGKPKKSSGLESIWQVSDKILRLSWQADSGCDGFYNQIVLEAIPESSNSESNAEE